MEVQEDEVEEEEEVEAACPALGCRNAKKTVVCGAFLHFQMCVCCLSLVIKAFQR